MKHLHSLPLTKQIQLIHKISQGEVTATVKEDGMALTVGISPNGQPFVSRESKVSKGAKRYFSVLECQADGANQGLCEAAALWCTDDVQAVLGEFKGFRWACEFVFPNHNVVQYAKSEIIVLFGLPNEIDGTISETDLIHTILNVRESTVVPCPDVLEIVQFLKSVDRGHTNEEILSVNLSSVPVAERSALRSVRDFRSATFTNMTRQLEAGNGLFREGLVLDDGEELVKIVNPLFVVQNQFYHGVRNCIKKQTFSNTFSSFFPTYPSYWLDRVTELWKLERCALADSELQYHIIKMRTFYEQAQENGQLNGPTSRRYPEHIHNQTIAAFETVISSLERTE